MLDKNEANGGENVDGVVVQDRMRTHGRLALVNTTANPCSQEDRIQLRLTGQDLRCGAWVSTREGDVQRLWVVEAIMTGAGDGCVELTLRPQLT